MDRCGVLVLGSHGKVVAIKCVYIDLQRCVGHMGRSSGMFRASKGKSHMWFQETEASQSQVARENENP